MEKHIAMARVDDRLIHGQVMTAWLQHSNSKHILIVDDELAEDQFMKSIVTMVLPPTIKVDIMNVRQGAEYLKQTNEKKLFLLTKHLVNFYLLQELGVRLKEITIGGISAKIGRKKLYKSIYISEEEISCAKKIMAFGTIIKIQIVPDDKAMLLKNYLEEK